MEFVWNSYGVPMEQHASNTPAAGWVLAERAGVGRRGPGELIRFNTPQGRLGGTTAAARCNALFAVRGRNIVEIKLAIHPSSRRRAPRV